jgi:hypothetical protein
MTPLPAAHPRQTDTRIMISNTLLSAAQPGPPAQPEGERNRAVAEFKSVVRAENLHIRPDGSAVVPLELAPWELVVRLRLLGRVVACTANPHATLCVTRAYPCFKHCRCRGRALDPLGRLAFLLSGHLTVRAWHELVAGQPTLGLEWVDPAGERVHRCGLLPDAHWMELVRLVADGQPGGARGLRLPRPVVAGGWQHADHSAAVWVEPEVDPASRRARSWREELRRRRTGLSMLPPGRARRIGRAELLDFLHDRRDARPLEVAVVTTEVMQTVAFLRPACRELDGTWLIESAHSLARFDLRGLHDFWQVVVGEEPGEETACEAYDARGDLVLALRRVKPGAEAA